MRVKSQTRNRSLNLPIDGTTDKPFKLSTDRSQRCNLEVKSVRAFFLLLCAPVSSGLRSRVCMSAFIHLFVHGRTQGWKSTRVLRSRSCRCRRGTRYSSVGPIHEHRGNVCIQGWRGDWPVPRCRLEEPRGRSLARHRLRYPGPPCTHSNIRTHTYNNACTAGHLHKRFVSALRSERRLRGVLRGRFEKAVQESRMDHSR